MAARIRRGIQQQAERRIRRIWHFVNLPAASDVRRLREQVDLLHRELRAVKSGRVRATSQAESARRRYA
jgi:polyhydroxyalkanoate synthesis regulator phasin